MNKLIYRFIIVTLLITGLSSNSIADEINEIYINASGNNKYEAQIKANKKGMKRALSIIIDKLGIAPMNMKDISYLKLKEIFKITSIQNEQRDSANYSATVDYEYDIADIEQRDSANYSATVDYEYDIADINILLINYHYKAIQDKYYQYLIIPVLQQGSLLYIWDHTNSWHQQWNEVRDVFKYYNLLLPQATNRIKKEITSKNILSLSYKDFLHAFHEYFIKNVMLVIAEYRTDPNTGVLSLEVKNIILESNNSSSTDINQYPLNNTESNEIISMVITQIAQQYGKMPINVPELGIIKGAGSLRNAILDNNAQMQNSELRKMDFNFSVFSAEELALIKEKLSKIQAIDSFKINNYYHNKYTATILTQNSDATLAEEFYMNGLSFKIKNDKYKLINLINKGA